MLFHKSLGLPASIQLPRGRKKMVLTNHAKEAARDDRYGNIAPLLALYSSFDPATADLVEIETSDRIHVEKAVYRVPLAPNSPYDVVLAAVPYGDKYVIKTLWINERSDRHRTLNTRKYSKP